MSDVDAWVDLDGQESEPIRSPEDASRYLPSTTLEEEQSTERRFFEKLDAALAQRGEPKVSAVAPPWAASPLARVEEQRQVSEEGATVRSPSFDERALAAPPADPLVASPPAQPFVAPLLALPIVPSPPVNAGCRLSCARRRRRSGAGIGQQVPQMGPSAPVFASVRFREPSHETGKDVRARREPRRHCGWDPSPPPLTVEIRC